MTAQPVNGPQNGWPDRPAKDASNAPSSLEPVRIFVRPLGTPLPLGFFAFGMGLVVLSGMGLHWFPPSDRPLLAHLIFSFVVPVEVLATVLAYLARDTPGATTMGFFAATWAAVATTTLTSPAMASPVLGVFLLTDCVAVAALAFVAWAAKPFFTVILSLTAIRFILTALSHLGLPSSLNTIGSIVGLVDAVLAFYGGVAFLLEEARPGTPLPLFRRGPASQAMTADLRDQIRGVQNEPGVRAQL